MERETERLLARSPSPAARSSSSPLPSTVAALPSRMLFRSCALGLGCFSTALAALVGGNYGAVTTILTAVGSGLGACLLAATSCGGMFSAGTLCKECHARFLARAAKDGAKGPDWKMRCLDFACFSLLLSAASLGFAPRTSAGGVIAGVCALFSAIVHMLLMLNFVPSFVANIDLTWPKGKGVGDEEAGSGQQTSAIRAPYEDAEAAEYSRTGASMTQQPHA